MKTWFWLFLTIFTVMAGCAPGYYEKGPAYQPEAPALTGKWFQNPETGAEESMRIWREESGR
jgi:hypothetical protein